MRSRVVYMQQARTTAQTLAEAMTAGCVGTRIERLHRLVAREFEKGLRPLGLSLPQLEILAALTLYDESVRPATVAELLAVDRSTMSRNLAALQQRGWVHTTSTSSSGRSLAVAITPAGTDALASADHVWRETQRALLERLGPEAPAVLGSWLGTLDHDVDPSRHRNEPSVTPRADRAASHGDLTGST